jgi:predicted Zn-dependent peptidase
MFKKTTLKNGLRLITVPMENTKAVTILIMVKTGSKYETKEINGISHFLEHMFFKGTKKRPTTLEITETIDRVGGTYNAFTGKEYTGYWVKVDAKYLDLALDWVSDVFLNHKIEEKEIEKEKGVIIEEFNMYLDTPMTYIGDVWEMLLYGDQPAGWLTIGTKANVLRFKRKNFLEYIRNHYSSKNTVVCLAGNIKADSIENKINKYFKNIRTTNPKPKLEVIESQSVPQSLIYTKETDQTHLALGVRGYDLSNPKRFAQIILAKALGGFMSSRLFISVREKRGLAYYVKTYSESTTDTGYLATFAGVDNRNVEKAIKLILEEYKSLRDKKITKAELHKAKENLKGTLTLSLESSDSQASYYTGQEVLTKEIVSPEQQFKRIDKVTPDQVQAVAKEIFRPEKLNLALIGPFKDEDKFKKLLKL